jgi:hypothetical protein
VTPAPSSDEWRLTQLNQRIERLQAETEELERQRTGFATQARAAARRLRTLQLMRWLRAPAASFELWLPGVLLVGPLLVGGLALVLVHAVTGSLGLGLLAFIVGALRAAALFASLLYRPSDAVLPAAIEEAAAERRLAEGRLEETVKRLSSAKTEHAALLEESRALMASGKVQRAALLQREWKGMSETEWEDFVVEVFRTLGATVERAPRAAEVDASLLVRFENRTVAVVTRGEGKTVNSRAVQQALAAKKLQHADRCAVVINRRFTGAAQDFARHNGCTAVGVEEFPDFVMGRIEL